MTEHVKKLLALDPGGTTGWSLWYYGDITPLTHIEHGMIGGGVEGFVRWYIEDAPEFDEIVSESFVLDGRTVSPDVTPLRIEGALVALWPEYVIYQRNLLKRLAPDDLLKRIGLWWAGKGHDRDSARHALALMQSRKHIPTLKWLFPPE